jgi:hypothetical protein
MSEAFNWTLSLALFSSAGFLLSLIWNLRQHRLIAGLLEGINTQRKELTKLHTLVNNLIKESIPK